ncbi:hypothetical protein ACTJK4_14245 [Ralstonia sp. 22111]|uniref:hypothetical protein n=1 Tax=Ralstonia sp. 22111 TaxID=3453878 RepID=UPI003F8548C6
MATTLYAAFSDAKKTVITSVFTCAQSADSFPYQDEVASDDARYVSYYNQQTELFPSLAYLLVKPGE